MIANPKFTLQVLLALTSMSLLAQDEDIYQKGIDLYFRDDYPASLTYLDSAIHKDPDDISRYFFRSKIHEKLGNYTSAIVDLSTCIDKSSNDALYLNARAVNYVRIDQIDLAMEDYTRSINLKATWRNYYERGMLYARKRQFKNAIKDFNSSIKIDKNQYKPLQARALAKFELGDKKEACDDMFAVFDRGIGEVKEWLIKNCK